MAKPAPVRPSRGRMVGARLLVALGALFAVLALLAGYIRWQGLDTETVRGSAGDLIADEDIRNEIAATLVDSLFTNVDVAAQLAERLPPDQQGLAGLVAAGIRELSDRAAVRLLERPRPQELWVNTVALSHSQLLNVLEDDVQGVSTEDGAVFLDLRPLVIELGSRVPAVGRIAAQLPEDAARIKVLEADQLETAQDLTRLLKALGNWLWVVPILLWALALGIAAGRRRVILRSIAIGSIIAGLLVLVLRRLAGQYLVDELVVSTTAQTAAGDAWDILTSLLSDGGWTLIGLGVIVLVAAWLAGPGRAATAARSELAPFLARPEIAFGAAAALFLLLILWSPTVQTTRVPLMLAAAIVLAFGIEILRRQVAREHPDAAGVDLSDHLRARFARTPRA
jgi:hypothetical protein